MKMSIPIVLSVILLAGIIAPVYAQSAEHVVINEVEINPPGNDASSVSEWVELYNPTSSDVDLSGWKIASTTVLKKTMIIPSGTIIKPGQFLTYSYQSLWFTDSNESVELRDNNDTLIDKTPPSSDIFNDFKSWQRIYDGYDFDSTSDWKFATSTAGSSNGKLVVAQNSNDVVVTVSTDKPSYLFGQTAVIGGTVSKEVFTVKPTFQPAEIIVKITGPNYDKSISLYPDLNLKYKTTLSLQQVLGIYEGEYTVSVTYAGTNSKTNFSVGHQITELIKKEDASLSLVTDKTQYLPGQLVSITGFTSKVIPFEGMKVTVKDPKEKIISTGNLFPTKDKFSTSVFLNTVKPEYGTYQVYGEYFDKSASTTFEVVKDVKEDVLISLWTDKEVYGLGETVNITGRLNDKWIDSFDLEIKQTKNLSTGVTGVDSSLKILDVVRLDGDGKFKYSFQIPSSASGLGGYTIKVSKEIGSASKVILVVKDPSTYIKSNDALSVSTDKTLYDYTVDKKILISGQIANPVSRTSFETAPVKITILDESGKSLQIIGSADAGKLSTSGVSVGYDFTAIPESSGIFSTNIDLSRLIFSEGKYMVKAQYEGLTATNSFQVTDSLKLGDTKIHATLDKSVYGLGETVKVKGTFGAQTRDSQGMVITVYKPSGDVHKAGTIIDSGLFSWSWVTPISEKTQLIGNDRSAQLSNYGVYRIILESEGIDTDLFFKVSANPENDELVVPTLSVTTSKSLYQSGETLYVEGTVNKRLQDSQGLISERVTVKILDDKTPFKQIYESTVYPDQSGKFKTSFTLPVTIFSEGQYKVKALYSTKQTESIFSVVNDFAFGSDDALSLILSTDKSEYYPGDVAIISGKPNKLIYLEKFEVGVTKQTENEITCGSFICGKNDGPVTTIRPSPSGSFSYQFKIPNTTSAIGSYQVTVNADFQTKSIEFNVVEKPLAPKLDVLVEKENRISEKMITVVTATKTIDSQILSPRVLSGSLFTTSRGDESSVNLQVTSSDGTCVIGQTDECLVKESTRKQGQIYDVVEIDGMKYNVRYSGTDVRLEKFSILPESSSAFLPDTNWNVEIIKDDQISRFYYKLTYKNLE